MKMLLGEEPVNLKQIDYLIRQGGRHGHITKYQVEVSTTGTKDEDFKVIKVGTFVNNGENLVNPSEFKYIIFGEACAKYVRFTVLELLGGTKNILRSQNFVSSSQKA